MWNTGKYRLELTNSTTPHIVINEEYVRIDGLQINAIDSGARWPTGIQIGINNINSDVKISNNIFQANFSGLTNYGYGIGSFSANNSVARIWNNIIYGFTGGSGGTDYGIYDFAHLRNCAFGR